MHVVLAVLKTWITFIMKPLILILNEGKCLPADTVCHKPYCGITDLQIF